jgi:hypothetical protein
MSTSAAADRERAVHRAFSEWAEWRKWTMCWDCDHWGDCGACHRRGPFLCVGCFDVRSPKQRRQRR